MLHLHKTYNRDNLCWGQSQEYAFYHTVAFPPFVVFYEPVFADKKREKIEIGGMECNLS